MNDIVFLIFTDRYTLSWLFGIKKRQLIICLVATVFLLVFIPVYTDASYSNDLISKESLMNKKDTGITLTDRQGRTFFTFYNGKYKKFKPLSDIPLVTQQAVISVEDKDFYNHPGFSLKAILRSVLFDLQKKNLSYGGSTITQQLVKNSLLTNKKDFLRKYQEIVLAGELEKKFTKGQILEMYLNSVYFGEGAFGVGEAARIYFGQEAKDLNLAQSAMLAGLLESPSQLSPFSGDQVKARLRQKQVLDAMVKQGYISPKDAELAKNQDLRFQSKGEGVTFLAPHFALMVRDELVKRYGEEVVVNSGFRVKTTIDLDWQKVAEKVVALQVEKLKPNQVTNGAVVVVDPKTGEIKALVGSTDWDEQHFGKINMTLFPRSPGSSFKPIVYLAAFEKGLVTPATILKDQPTIFKNDIQSHDPTLAYYKPQNYDRKFRGLVSVRRALANSLNVPSVELLSKLGIPSTLEMAQRLGITSLGEAADYGLSLVLGTGEAPLLQMVQAYSVLANAGYKNDLTTINEIDDREGQVIYHHTPEQGLTVDPKYIFLVSSILSDNKTRAEEFGNLLDISRPAAIKTGTAEDFRDSWTLGYTPSLVVGAWVGNDDGRPMDQVAGSLGAAPILKTLMEQFLKDTPVEKFEPPEGIVAKSICGQTEYFVQGSEPTIDCTIKTPKQPQPVQIQVQLVEQKKD